MQSTTNYSMNLVEGTDLVNIPVQLNPNFQTVDAEMFKNKQAGIGTATEVVTATVHAIVRANPDADVFRFTATGAWTAGDTMTLDGSAVTVHLTDGTAPATGAYIIGAEVIGVVNGTLVTLISSSAAVDPGVTSFNTRTGAVTPAASDYDASMIDYDNTLSGLTATDCQAAIDELAAATPTINLKYETVATASANQTWTAQLAYLKTFYDNLTEDEKRLTALITATGTLIKIDTTSIGRFSTSNISGTNVVITCARLDDATFKSTVGIAVSDASTSTNTGTLTLLKLTA